MTSPGALAAALARGWGLAAHSMAYQPAGFGSHHWKIIDAAGIPWFITVDDLPAKRHWQGEPLAAAFGRLRAFAGRCRGPQGLRPCVRRGASPVPGRRAAAAGQ